MEIEVGTKGRRVGVEARVCRHSKAHNRILCHLRRQLRGSMAPPSRRLRFSIGHRGVSGVREEIVSLLESRFSHRPCFSAPCPPVIRAAFRSGTIERYRLMGGAFGQDHCVIFHPVDGGSVFPSFLQPCIFHRG